jgi:hypothetical protein
MDMSEIEITQTVSVQDEAIACLPRDGDTETDAEVLKSVPNGFAINCGEHANWLVRRIKEARSYGDSVKAWTEKEVRRAQREEQTLMFLFGRQLETWFAGELEKVRGRRKSISLPAGTIGLRMISPTLQIDDEQCVIAWAMTHCPAAVQTTRKLWLYLTNAAE